MLRSPNRPSGGLAVIAMRGAGPRAAVPRRRGTFICRAAWPPHRISAARGRSPDPRSADGASPEPDRKHAPHLHSAPAWGFSTRTRHRCRVQPVRRRARRKVVAIRRSEGRGGRSMGVGRGCGI